MPEIARQDGAHVAHELFEQRPIEAVFGAHRVVIRRAAAVARQQDDGIAWRQVNEQEGEGGHTNDDQHRENRAARQPPRDTDAPGHRRLVATGRTVSAKAPVQRRNPVNVER